MLTCPSRDQLRESPYNYRVVNRSKRRKQESKTFETANDYTEMTQSRGI